MLRNIITLILLYLKLKCNDKMQYFESITMKAISLKDDVNQQKGQNWNVLSKYF